MPEETLTENDFPSLEEKERAKYLDPRAHCFQNLTQFVSWIKSLNLSPQLRERIIGHLVRFHDRLDRTHAQEMTRVTRGLVKKIDEEAKTVDSVATYFEDLVKELGYKATRDSLTGLLDLATFQEMVAAFLNSDRRSRCCAFGLGDIYKFKTINDRWGHDAGNLVLKAVASEFSSIYDAHYKRQSGPERRIEEPLSHFDKAARIGGDEFAFFVTNVENVRECRQIGERLIRDVAKTRILDYPDLQFEIDIGIICCKLPAPAERPNGSELLRHFFQWADYLMYLTKAFAASESDVAGPYRHLSVKNIVVKGRELDKRPRKALPSPASR